MTQVPAADSGEKGYLDLPKEYSNRSSVDMF